MIFIAGISIALFISALLLVKKNKSQSDYFLLIWMLINSAHLFFHHLNDVGALYEYPHLLGIQLPFPLFQGVLLYFYVSSVTNQNPSKKWYYFLHLIPPIVVYLYLIKFFLLPGPEKIEIFKLKGGEEYASFMALLQMSVFLSGVIYVVWCSILLVKHKKNIKSQFSDIQEISLLWLQFLVIGLGLVWCLVIITQSDSLIYQAVAIFVILIGFFGVQQKNIFNKPSVSNAFKPSPSNLGNAVERKAVEKEKYKSSGLSPELSNEHFQQLTKLMQEEKLYTNASLSLGDLAHALELHPNYLSQIINEKGGKSFYDFVNNYRVQEFKSLLVLPENKNFTLMTLAYDCGFNSKSSFNRYFKKLTGQTPSQFAKQHL